MSESNIQVKIKAVDNMSGKLSRLVFIVMYNDLVNKQGYQRGFIRSKIAEHCKVSEHTVSKWISGKPVREIYLDKLKTFEVKK